MMTDDNNNKQQNAYDILDDYQTLRRIAVAYIEQVLNYKSDNAGSVECKTD
jgi:hypothetical protein